MNLSDAVADYCDSEHFIFLSDSLKSEADVLLSHWAREMGDAANFDALQGSVRRMASLNLQIELKREFPDLLDAFFGYLASSAGHPEAERWLEYMSDIGPAYTNDLRADGTLKGETVTRALKIGRNDPCPCGSGRKFKRCCGK